MVRVVDSSSGSGPNKYSNFCARERCEKWPCIRKSEHAWQVRRPSKNGNTDTVSQTEHFLFSGSRAMSGTSQSPIWKWLRCDDCIFCHLYFIIPEPKTALASLPLGLLSITKHGTMPFLTIISVLTAHLTCCKSVACLLEDQRDLKTSLVMMLEALG